MLRKQTFTVTIKIPYKDGCRENVPAYNCGDIRTALMKGLSRFESIYVEERGDTEEVKGKKGAI